MDSTPKSAISGEQDSFATKHLLVFFTIFSAYVYVKLTTFFRALRLDSRVLHLNIIINCDRDWPSPYLLSRLIRSITYLIKMSCLGVKKVLYSIGQSTLQLARWLSRGRHTQKIETVRSKGKLSEKDMDGENSVEKAKNAFRLSLLRVFGETDDIGDIMADIDLWEEGRYVHHLIYILYILKLLTTNTHNT